MNEFSISGGASIGNTGASWPLATLKVTPNMFLVSIGFAGQVYFNADDIISIEPTSGLSGGIRIIHNIKSYPQKVVFFTNTPYYNIIENIKATGFFNKEALHDQSAWYQVKNFRNRGGCPLKRLLL
jgi:hypothetical protein